ncbi:response regulator [Heliobacterium gestii]|uniref:Stage 0 sporulation protein A homolog n=1 Tax=Heliomicrobium gestii TaxID=2699 RepID=A0A845L9G7_HELGE|nr:response regulator transcription factor [Heliomicrobium gestii]MBM7865299.1 DNA-binding response OmpR family regulator [Heliomicrobium gestii]MZP41560.1 response regulator [Heliomicrobium gestii]
MLRHNDLRILAVEDEANLLQLVTAYLEQEGFSVKGATNGREALQHFRDWRPHLLILDRMLPDISGEEVCRQIRRESDIPILMLTAKAGEDHLVEGLSLGADDYVTKPFSPKEVMARVRALLRRSRADRLPQAEEFRFDEDRLIIRVARQEVLKDGEPVSLTAAEFRLLVTLARRPGMAYTRGQLIDKAMGDDFDGYDRTIDTHIKNLRQKLEDQPRQPRYIVTVFGTGYKFGVEA